MIPQMHIPRKQFSVLVIVLGLTGCAQMRDQRSCASYGFPEGSAGYADCMMALQQLRAHRQADLTRTLLYLDATHPQPYQLKTYQPPPQRSFTCWTYGSQTRCQ